MAEQSDPGHAGVIAGRVVGVLTAGLVVVMLVHRRETWYAFVTTLSRSVDLGLTAGSLFWAIAFLAAVARYVSCYLVGSLVGIAFGWLDRPGWAVLLGMVLVVGLIDAVLAALATTSVVFVVGYAVAWLVYLPVFRWRFDPDAGETGQGPRRLP